MDKKIENDFAFTLGKLFGMIGRDEVKTYLLKAGATLDEIKDLESSLEIISNCFYGRESGIELANATMHSMNDDINNDLIAKIKK